MNLFNDLRNAVMGVSDLNLHGNQAVSTQPIASIMPTYSILPSNHVAEARLKACKVDMVARPG